MNKNANDQPTMYEQANKYKLPYLNAVLLTGSDKGVGSEIVAPDVGSNVSRA